MTKRLVVLGCAAIAVVALWWTFFRASDEDEIRQTLGALVDAVAVKEGDTLISRTARIRSRLNGLVDEDVRVDVDELNRRVRGRDELEQAAVTAGRMFQTIDEDFANLSIKIDPAGTLAQVDATLIVTAHRAGERTVDKRGAHFLLRKDGDWKITTIDIARSKGSVGP